MVQSTSLLLTAFTGIAAIEAAAPQIGAPIQCDGDDLAVFRVISNTEIRWYPNPEIADSWDPNWRTVLVHINCDGLTKGPDMRSLNEAPIQCDDNELAVYRVADNQKRWYPNPEIADSWDPKWRTDLVRINCDGLTKGPDMPSRDGAPIQCDGDDLAVYRVISNTEIRWYPNPEIAESWDPKWTEFVRINCDGLTKGPDMRPRNEAPIQCDDNELAVYRVADNQKRWYPNPEIADSWDPKWRTDLVRINCDGLTKGPDMPSRDGAPIQCDGDDLAVYRVISNTEIRWYPNPEIAESWDPKWTEFVRINCDGLTKGEELAMKEVNSPSPTPSLTPAPAQATHQV